MTTWIVACATLAFFPALLISFPAAGGEPPRVDVDQVLSYVTTEAEARADLELATAPVHSFDELDRYVQTTSDEGSVFSPLSPAARTAFKSSLTFNANGITSFDYRILRDNLTPTQVYRVLRLFGVQRLAPMISSGQRVETPTDLRIIRSPYLGKDHEGYRCEEKGTCVTSLRRICTDNC